MMTPPASPDRLLPPSEIEMLTTSTSNTNAPVASMYTTTTTTSPPFASHTNGILNSSSTNINEKRRRSKKSKPIIKKDSDHDKDKPQRTTTSSRTQRRISCITILLVFLPIYLVFRYSSIIQNYTHSNGNIQTKLNSNSDIRTYPLQPETIRIRSIQHYYLLPSQQPKVILIVLHSCQQTGLDFFQLPEERIILYQALSMGMAIFAPTSQNAITGCWQEQDVSYIGGVIDSWTKQFSDDYDHLEKLPRVGLASSSASSFMIRIYTKISISSMALYNSITPYPESHLHNLPAKAIPTVYINMSKDKTLLSLAKTHMKALQTAGIPTQLYRVSTRPFTLRVCNARIPELQLQCQEIINEIDDQYPNHKLLNVDGYIRRNVKPEQWQSVWNSLHIDDWVVYRNDSSIIDDDNNKKKRWGKRKKKKKKEKKKRHWWSFRSSTTTQTDNMIVSAEYSPNSKEIYHTIVHPYTGHSWLWESLEQQMQVSYGYHVITSEYHMQVLQFLLEHSGAPQELHHDGNDNDNNNNHVYVRGKHNFTDDGN